MRRAYDSVTVADLPADGDLYLGYVDGSYANVDAIRRRFPHKPVVGITVTGQTLDAHMADVERGDLSPASGAAWAARKVKAGQHPTIYTYAANAGAVQAACSAAGLTPVQWSLFIAAYDGKAEVPHGTVGKQYLGSPGNSPGHYDVSAVADYWPGVDQPPLRPPKPKPNRATPLALSTRVALRLAAKHLATRHNPVAGIDQPVLADALAQIQRVRGLK